MNEYIIQIVSKGLEVIARELDAIDQLILKETDENKIRWLYRSRIELENSLNNI